MQTGTYKTTDPNVRIRVVQDDNFHDDSYFIEGVREALLEAHEAGDVYGVIVERRYEWTRINEAGDTDGTTRFEWEYHDSAWSCVGYENVAEEIAKEYSGITVTGRE